MHATTSDSASLLRHLGAACTLLLLVGCTEGDDTSDATPFGQPSNDQPIRIPFIQALGGGTTAAGDTGGTGGDTGADGTTGTDGSTGAESTTGIGGDTGETGDTGFGGATGQGTAGTGGTTAGTDTGAGGDTGADGSADAGGTTDATDTGGGGDGGLVLLDPNDRLPALYGTLDIEWAFSLVGSSPFRETVVLGPDGRVVDDTGTVLVLAQGDDAGQWDFFGCSVLPAPDNRYLCIGVYESGARNFFVFDLDASGTLGTGEFEFCTVEQEDEACGRDFSTSPDGTVVVTVDRLADASRAAARAAPDRNTITEDIETHMTGLDQGGPHPMPGETADDADVAPFVRLAAEACRVAGVCR